MIIPKEMNTPPEKEIEKPKVLALDFGANLGWSIRWIDGEITSGCEKLTVPTKTVKKKKIKEHEGMRFYRFKEFLNKLDGATHIFYEKVWSHGKGGINASHQYGGYEFLLWEHCIRNNIKCNSYGVGTIKKRATGSGKASKEQMMEAATKTFKQEIANDNQADSLWLLVLSCEKLGLKVI